MRAIPFALLVIIGLAAAAHAAPIKPGCYAIKAASTGKFLSHNGPVPFYAANRTAIDGWERFRLIKAGGLFRIRGTDGRYIASRNAQIFKSGGGMGGLWNVVSVGDKVAFRTPDRVWWLSADGVLDGVVRLMRRRRAWELFTLVPIPSCR